MAGSRLRAVAMGRFRMVWPASSGGGVDKLSYEEYWSYISVHFRVDIEDYYLSNLSCL